VIFPRVLAEVVRRVREYITSIAQAWQELSLRMRVRLQEGDTALAFPDPGQQNPVPGMSVTRKRENECRRRNGISWN
jgi:hypothetical protein